MTFSTPSGNATYEVSSLVSWYGDLPRFRWPSMSRVAESDLTFDPSDDLYYSSLVFVAVFVEAIGAVFVLTSLTYLLIFWKCLPKWRDHFDYDYSKYENGLPKRQLIIKCVISFFICVLVAAAVVVVIGNVKQSSGVAKVKDSVDFISNRFEKAREGLVNIDSQEMTFFQKELTNIDHVIKEAVKSLEKGLERIPKEDQPAARDFVRHHVTSPAILLVQDARQLVDGARSEISPIRQILTPLFDRIEMAPPWLGKFQKFCLALIYPLLVAVLISGLIYVLVIFWYRRKFALVAIEVFGFLLVLTSFGSAAVFATLGVAVGDACHDFGPFVLKQLKSIPVRTEELTVYYTTCPENGQHVFERDFYEVREMLGFFAVFMQELADLCKKYQSFLLLDKYQAYFNCQRVPDQVHSLLVAYNNTLDSLDDAERLTSCPEVTAKYLTSLTASCTDLITGLTYLLFAIGSMGVVMATVFMLALHVKTGRIWPSYLNTWSQRNGQTGTVFTIDTESEPNPLSSSLEEPRGELSRYQTEVKRVDGRGSYVREDSVTYDLDDSNVRYSATPGGQRALSMQSDTPSELGYASVNKMRPAPGIPVRGQFRPVRGQPTRPPRPTSLPPVPPRNRPPDGDSSEEDDQFEDSAEMTTSFSYNSNEEDRNRSPIATNYDDRYTQRLQVVDEFDNEVYV